MIRGQKESQQRCQARAVVGPAPVAMTKCLTRSNLWEKVVVTAYISVSVITAKPWGQESETAGNTSAVRRERRACGSTQLAPFQSVRDSGPGKGTSTQDEPSHVSNLTKGVLLKCVTWLF